MNNKRKAEMSRTLSSASTFLTTLTPIKHNGGRYYLISAEPLATLIKNLNKISDEIIDSISVEDETDAPLNDVK